jgi:hypothetical protein
MTSPDYYAMAREVASALRAEGLGDWGSRLEDAIAAGATSTEILMALRWHLRALRSNPVQLSPETERAVRQLLAVIEHALA